MKNQKKNKMPTVIKVLLIVLAVLIVVTAVLAVVIYNSLKNKIDKNLGTKVSGDTLSVNMTFDELAEATPRDNEVIDAPEATEEEVAAMDDELDAAQELEDVEVDEEIVNYLLIGNDTRTEGAYANSDTMIVVSVNPKTQKVHLTSFMRAMYVNIPGYFHGMLNWSYQLGGPELTAKTIEENFGIHIDHYIAVDFSEFEAVVDILGGVDLELTQAEADRINSQSTSGTPCVEGMNHLNGEQALYHARNRKLDGDFNRTRRQRNLVEALIEQLQGASLSQLNDLADEILPYVLTDMTSDEILSTIPQGLKWLDYDIDQLMLPVENMAGDSFVGVTVINGHEMYKVNWENNLAALEEFINS